MFLVIVSVIVAIPVLCLAVRCWWIILVLGILLMASPVGAAFL